MINKLLELIQRYKGQSVVVGGFMIHLVLGTLYLWGGISAYVTSYLRQYDNNLSIHDMQGVFPFMGLSLHLTQPFGVPIARKIGARKLALIVITLNSLFIYISGKTTNKYTFFLTYSIIPGCLKGFCYLLPVYCGWQYFPNKKGLISGITFCGYGLGTFFFNFLTTAIANPRNISPSIIIQEGLHTVHYFDQQVYKNIPKMLTGLSIALFVLGIAGALLIDVPQNVFEKQKQQPLISAVNSTTNINNNEVIDAKTGLKSKIFWHLFIMGTLSSSAGFFIANVYKNYGFNKINDDHMLTTVGAVASIFNGLSRIFWAQFLDRFLFRSIYRIIILGLFVLIVTLDSIASSPGLYLIWISLIMFHEGGHFSMFPTVCNKIFGEQHGYFITGVLTMSFAMANFMGFFFSKYLVKIIGFQSLFLFYGALESIAFILLIYFDENHKWGKTQKNVEMLEF